MPPWPAVDASGQTLEVHDFLSFRLMVALNVLNTHVTKQYFDDSTPVSLPAWRLLGLLHQHGTVPTRTIARHGHMDKSQISRTVDELAKAGLVERLKDPSHATRQLLRMTEAGNTVFQSILKQARPLHARVLMGLSEKERETFNTLLGKLLTAAVATSFVPPSKHA